MMNKFRRIFSRQNKENSTKSQLPIFIVLSLVISISLSGWSLWLYNESGAAQLDLSRPSYQEAREKAKKEEEEEKKNQNNKDFSAEGAINDKTITEFKEIYKDRFKKIESNAFKEDPLSDITLDISE